MRASTLSAVLALVVGTCAPGMGRADAAESPAVTGEAEAPSPRPLPELEERSRSSFFGRMTLGLGYGAVNASDDTALPPLDETFHGWSLAPSFAVGTRTREALFLHAQGWFGGVTEGDYKLFRPGMRMAAAGLGFTYYFLPARIYVSGTPAISITFFRRRSSENYDAAALGFGAMLAVGRDFVLRNGWTLGCELEGRISRTRADAEVYLGGIGVLAFTVAYGAPD